MKRINTFGLTFIILTIVLLAIGFYIFYPLLLAFVGGVTVSYIFHPVVKRFSGSNIKKKVVSGLMVLIVVVPSIFVGIQTIITVVTETSNLIDYVSRSSTYIISSLRPIEAFLSQFNVSVNFEGIITSFIKILREYMSSEYIVKFLFSIPSMVIQLFVFAATSYYFLRDGDKLIAEIRGLVQGETSDFLDELIKEMDTIFKGIFYGYILASLIVSIISVPFYELMGFSKYSTLLGLLTFIVGVLPVVGTPIIYVPLAMIKFFSDPFSAVLILVFGTVVLVVLPTFVITPYFAEKSAAVHPLIVLLSFIAGPMVFGAIGFIVGPVVLGFLLSVYRVVKKIGVNRVLNLFLG